MKLAKWQGLGNDYLIVEESALPGPLTADGHRPALRPSPGGGLRRHPADAAPTGAVPGAVARMRIFNPDGSEPEMCGNGIRMFARYLAPDGRRDRAGVHGGDPGRSHQAPAARATARCGWTWAGPASASANIDCRPRRWAAAERRGRRRRGRRRAGGRGARLPLHLRRRGQPPLRHPGGRPGGLRRGQRGRASSSGTRCSPTG